MVRRNGTMFLASAWLVFLILAAIVSPFFLNEKSQAMDFAHALESPSSKYLLGTDSLGRDLLFRLLCGSAASLGVAASSVLVAVLIGILIGAVSGYAGGAWDGILMGFVDLMLCVPAFFLMLAVVAMTGPSVAAVLLVIGLTSWMGVARLVRAEVLVLKEKEFVLAARALGLGPVKILFRHVIPNAMAPVIVSAVLGLSSAILFETGLSFLGMGVQPPVPSWGNILTEGKDALGVAWWLVLFPGAAIFLTTLSVNALGEGLRSRLAKEDRPHP